MYKLKKQGQSLVYKIVDPFVHLVHRMGITPNMMTTTGFVINLIATAIFVFGAEQSNRFDYRYIGLAGMVILFAGLFDMLDGRLARLSNQSSVYGALYDSVIDRYSEMFMFLGICYYLVSHHYFLSSIFAFIAMIGSIMVSYTRARAESLGVQAGVGVMQRPERIILIGISAIACGVGSLYLDTGFKIQPPGFPIPLFETISLFTFPIFVLAILSNMTAINRLLHSKKILEKNKK